MFRDNTTKAVANYNLTQTIIKSFDFSEYIYALWLLLTEQSAYHLDIFMSCIKLKLAQMMDSPQSS